MRSWRCVASKSLIRDRWLSLRADTCVLPNGRLVDPYYVIEDPEWVHVYAHDDHGRVLIVRQYRYAAEVECAELPGGAVESGESPLEAAKRELREETGYSALQWTRVGKLFANPARQTNAVHVFLAADLSRDGDQDLDESERISVEFASASEMKQMIAAGEFSQALHVASFFVALEATTRTSR